MASLVVTPLGSLAGSSARGGVGKRGIIDDTTTHKMRFGTAAIPSPGIQPKLNTHTSFIITNNCRWPEQAPIIITFPPPGRMDN